MARGQSKAESRSADNSLGVKKKQRKEKKPKKAKDPNKPKKPASAFLVFMEDFRKTFKSENPGNKSVAVVGKAGGEKWKSLTEEEKAPFQAMAASRKKDYDVKMVAYNRKQVEGNSDEKSDESDKSKSEVHDDEASEEEEDDA